MSGPTPFASSAEQLGAEFAWLELLLRQRVREVSARRGPEEAFDQFAGMYVSEREIARYATEPGQESAAADDGRARQQREQLVRHREDLDSRARKDSRSSGEELRLQRLARRFGLTQMELRVLMCCLAPDWELRFQRYFAYLQNDVNRRRPTVQLLGELFGEADDIGAVTRVLFSPDGALTREQLLTIPDLPDLPFPARQPVVAAAVADYLAGAVRPDARLAGFVRIQDPRSEWPGGRWYDRHREIVARLVRPLQRTGRLPTAYLCGAPGSETGLVSFAVASIAGVRLMRADCRAWLASRALTRELARAFRRDAIMHGCLIELARVEALLDPAAADQRIVIEEFLSENEAAGIILTGQRPVAELSAALAVPLWGFEIPRPDIGERADLWRGALSARGWQADATLIDALAAGFRFTPHEIHRALEGYDAAAGREPADGPDREALVRACRETSRHTIHRLARKIIPRRGWDDLVLPDDSRNQLEEICAGARSRRRVHDEWGFQNKLALGAGLNVLFAGPSGAGKTMSAEIVAGDLGLDLYAVDLSCVVSKYIGETEKNLSMVFDEAEATNAVLFFDECDALFGKRTEIKDAHDRYANIEVNYLLQRIDQYEGIVILATNLRSNLDPAFMRRIRYLVEFPLPEPQLREQIWRKVFPAEAPLGSDVDVAFLAQQFKLSGGSIRNIAVNAAFLAASNGGRVGMKQLIHATRRELQKTGKSCTKAEFGRYFPWVREPGQAAGSTE
jgi:DNA polymerase III delta prime subunit